MHSLTSEELDWIAGVVKRFETTWRDGTQSTTEEALAGVRRGAVRDQLLVRLLQAEIRFRRERGEVPGLAEYDSRFPEDAVTVRAMFEKSGESTESLDSRAQEEISCPSPASLELPGYEVLEAIGKGGMGIVYKARHLGLKRLVAIKVILPGMSTLRFHREARLIAGISSPHVVSVYDLQDLPDGRSLLVMEYVDGTDMQRVIKERGGALPEEQAATWMTQVCEGMMAAAEHHIIHRDLKPANMLIDRKGRVKVADFGLARSENALSDMTLTSHVMGTPHYMAPEQAEDPRGVDTRADIYSFGAAFYHALTGVPPFSGESPFSILYKHKTEPLISPRSRNGKISDRVCSIIERCLAKSPGDRFPSFAEVRSQLVKPNDLLSPWDMAENPELEKFLERYHERRQFYLAGPSSAQSAGETYHFPRGRILKLFMVISSSKKSMRLSALTRIISR